jgi:Ca2+-binding EF-hand superfamily protein
VIFFFVDIDMQYFFRSRLPPQLTVPQKTRLSNQSNLSIEEIQEWYERFTHCYPYGYVSFKEFLIYLKQLNKYNGNQPHQLSKLIIKQLFSKLNLNKDKQLNFEEFFRFNLLINQGSKEDKLKFILNVYDRQRNYYYTQLQTINILTDMFDLLNISISKDDLSRRIDTVLTHLKLDNRNSKICWNTFCISVLRLSSFRELLLADSFDENMIVTEF